MSKTLYAILFATIVAATVAMPVANDVQDIQDDAEFVGWIKNVVGSSSAKFKALIKGKTCVLRTCGKCQIKYRTTWGRRLLGDDSEDVEVEQTEGDRQSWGGFKRAIKRVVPKRVAYTDCTYRNKCNAENAACNGKIAALKAAVKALDGEIAKAKKVADAAGADAAAKGKVAALQAREAAAAKKARDDQQALISSLAKTLASEKKSQQITKDKMEAAVSKTQKGIHWAQKAKAKKDKELREFNERMAAPAKHAKKAAEGLAHAHKAHDAQKAAAAKANAKEAADVAKAAAALKKAEADLGGFSAKHTKEAAEAAKAAQAHKSAKTLHDLKKDVHKMHVDKRNKMAKKIEEAQ